MGEGWRRQLPKLLLGCFAVFDGFFSTGIWVGWGSWEKKFFEFFFFFLFGGWPDTRKGDDCGLYGCGAFTLRNVVVFDGVRSGWTCDRRVAENCEFFLLLAIILYLSLIVKATDLPPLLFVFFLFAGHRPC